MTEIKLYKTYWKALRLLVLAITFTVAGIWFTQKSQYGTFYYLIGWGCICFFGLAIPIGLFNLFDRRPQIIITEYGIWDRTTNEIEIKWEQIKGTKLININGQIFISLFVDETFIFSKKQYKWAAKLNEEIGAQKLNLSLGQLEIDPIKLSDLLFQITSSEKKERITVIRNYLST